MARNRIYKHRISSLNPADITNEYVHYNGGRHSFSPAEETAIKLFCALSARFGGDCSEFGKAIVSIQTYLSKFCESRVAAVAQVHNRYVYDGQNEAVKYLQEVSAAVDDDYFIYAVNAALTTLCNVYDIFPLKEHT